MAFFDLPLEELRQYCPPREEPADFDAFWDKTLADTRSFALDARFERVECGLRLIDAFDVTFNGWGGQPIKGWLMLPAGVREKLPCVVEYIGYGGGRGFPLDWLHMASAGYAHLIMDCRGQGSSWRTGDTPDNDAAGSSPHYPGFMTQGVLDPHTYYYRRLISDAVRAVEAARSHPAVDAKHIAVRGGSQGGALSLITAGLVPDLDACLTDVPFLCHYRRAVTITDGFPYGEIAHYLKIHRDQVETVFKTLSYFDGVNFAARARAQALFSVGLMDDICPPSTVFAAYNHYAGKRDIRVYQFNQHEGGETFQLMEQIKLLHSLWQK